MSENETKSKGDNNQKNLEVTSHKGLDTNNNDNPKSKVNIEIAKDNKELNYQSFIDLAIHDIKEERRKISEEINSLNKKKIQLEKEIKSSFTGQSDEIARKVKGFQEYLSGALQDLVQSTEKLEIIVEPVIIQPSPLDKDKDKDKDTPQEIEAITPISDTFKPDEDLIKECLNQFLGQPNFYAEPWKLRRSLDRKDISLLEEWFFNMGGRGALPSRGSRAKNILASSGLISILGELYGDRFQTLVLASQPERLGEWRRGLQDALGLSREDFGPNSGIVLFERADGLIERADRLEERDEVPLILVDASEVNIETPILQFPFWLAFVASQNELYLEEEEEII